MDELSERAIAIMRQNDRGGYSVPTDGLYPFQWNWDAGFTAMGYGCFDEARAWRELKLLLAGQWADGMVPHIVFHRDDPRYFPGPEIWGIERTPPTSGITQPPILAIAARRLLERAQDRAAAEAALRPLFPKLLACLNDEERGHIGTLGLVRAAPNARSRADAVFAVRVPQQKCYRSHRSLVIWGMSAQLRTRPRIAFPENPTSRAVVPNARATGENRPNIRPHAEGASMIPCRRQ